MNWNFKSCMMAVLAMLLLIINFYSIEAASNGAIDPVEVEVEWKQIPKPTKKPTFDEEGFPDGIDETDGPIETAKTSILPNEITMKMKLEQQTVKLNLTNKPKATENVKVLTSNKGRMEIWPKNPSEEWKVYSDTRTESSISVATYLTDGVRKTVYDGTFVANNTKYLITPDNGINKFPLEMESTKVLKINGTRYFLTEQRSSEAKLDVVREARGVNPNNKPLMTDLERLVNAQFQANSASKNNYGVEWKIQSSMQGDDAKTADAINNIRYFYTHIVNGINDRYSSIQEADMSFYVKLIGFYIAQTPNDSPFSEDSSVKLSPYSINVDRTLDKFQDWIKIQRENNRNQIFRRYDAVALFTDYEMTVVTSNPYQITGLSNIGAACTVLGVSINRDFGEYATIETSAHEIGHSLGAQHDGTSWGNSCDGKDQHIMASAPGSLTDATFKNPFTFSQCSVNYFREYIAKLDRENNNCLKNPAEDVDPRDRDSFLQVFPGQKYGIDRQCQLLFGQNSFYCAGGGERDKAVCRELICWNPKVYQCVRKVEQRALDGTTCANKSWCLRGTCTPDDRAPNAPESCIYGDSKDYIQIGSSKMSCSSMVSSMPWMCYEKYYYDYCCFSCKLIKNKNSIGCEFGNKDITLCQSLQSYQCYDSYYQSLCCATCATKVVNVPVSGCKYGDKMPWCNTILPTGCYNNDKACCQTCLKFKTDIPNCQYGDQVSGCTLNHCPVYPTQCCQTCKDFQKNPKPTTLFTTIKTSTTTTTTTTKSPTAPFCPNGDQGNFCNGMGSWDCYNYGSTCCRTCTRYYNPANTKCMYGDKVPWCSTYVGADKKECKDAQVADSCCSTCQKITKPTICKDSADWCSSMFPGFCYDSKTEATCCDSCKRFARGRTGSCRYGNFYNWCDPKYCSMNSVECCESCRS